MPVHLSFGSERLFLVSCEYMCVCIQTELAPVTGHEYSPRPRNSISSFGFDTLSPCIYIFRRKVCSPFLLGTTLELRHLCAMFETDLVRYYDSVPWYQKRFFELHCLLQLSQGNCLGVVVNSNIFYFSHPITSSSTKSQKSSHTMNVTQLQSTLAGMWSNLLQPTLSGLLNKQEWIGVYSSVPVPCMSGCNLSMYVGFEAADPTVPTGSSLSAGSPIEHPSAQVTGQVSDTLEPMRRPPPATAKGFVKPRNNN